MAKNTSLLLGEHYENLIDNEIKSGRYASASEVVRAALRLFEAEEKLKDQLINALEEGEASGYVQNFDRHTFLQDLHDNHKSKK
jgi:antitoxin ParD1/3/4